MADIDLIGYRAGKIRKPKAGDDDLDSIGILDSVELQIGTGNDLKLYHDGTHSSFFTLLATENAYLKI